MLKKANRLSTPFEFKITKKYGEKIDTNTYVSYILKPENYSGSTKFGFVVSTGFSKKATDRNRVKRLFREAVRNSLDLVPNDYWISIYPKYSSAGKTYEEISSDINKIIQKVSQSN